MKIKLRKVLKEKEEEIPLLSVQKDLLKDNRKIMIHHVIKNNLNIVKD